MGLIKWLLGTKEKISKKAIKHSTIGELIFLFFINS